MPKNTMHAVALSADCSEMTVQCMALEWGLREFCQLSLLGHSKLDANSALTE